MHGRLTASAVYCLLAAAIGYGQTSGLSLTVHGRIKTDRLSPVIRVVLENPKARPSVAGEMVTGPDGSYEFRDLNDREYRLIVWIDGKKQDRRDLEIVCRAGGTMRKDFFFGKSDPTLTFYFPGEDPDVVDAAELQGDYPRDVLKEYEKAYEDSINGKTLRAVQRLETIVSRAPNFYGAHARLGMNYQNGGCYFDAEAAYSRAAELSPRAAQPLVNLASSQIQSADQHDDPSATLQTAIENLQKALQIRPFSPVAHCLTGVAHAKASAFEEAERSYKRALELDDDMPAARLMLARLYMHQQNWEQAIEHFNEYLKDHPLATDRSTVKALRTEAEQNLRK